MSREGESSAENVIARPQRRPARPQLVGETIELLRSRLGSGEFKIGDRIPSETVLIEEFGIGRTTLREAVRVLEHAVVGCIEWHPGFDAFQPLRFAMPFCNARWPIGLLMKRSSAAASAGVTCVLVKAFW